MTRVGSAGSTVPSDRWASGSLNLSEEPVALVGSAVSTVPTHRMALDLDSLGMLAVVVEVLRLVLCRFGDGSGVLLRGNSSNLTISFLRPWELDIFFLRNVNSNTTTLQML